MIKKSIGVGAVTEFIIQSVGAVTDRPIRKNKNVEMSKSKFIIQSVGAGTDRPFRDSKDDNYYMNLALKEAHKALLNDDVPIGCVIVYNKNIKNKKMFNNMSSIFDFSDIEKTQIILSKAYNKRNKDKDAISHAEILAIKKACNRIKDYRLEDCTMYVNLEPCQMCAGAILQSRIKRLVVGCKSEKSGSCGSIINILDNDKFNHKVELVFGIKEQESIKLLKDYFKGLRERKNIER